MTEVKPGFWQSGLTEEQAISASTDYSQLDCSENGDLYWVEQRADEQGRNVLCCFSEGEVNDLTAEGFSVHSKVHEYGGRSWCLIAGGLVFVNGADQQLYFQSAVVKEQPVKITAAAESRFIEPVWDVQRKRIIAVQELHSGTDVINRLVSVSYPGGEIAALHQGCDFYAYPAVSASGGLLAFISWMHPEQPWTRTQLNLAELDSAGAVRAHSVIAGHSGSESISQAGFNAEALWFITDRSGWWNICSVTEDMDIKAEQEAQADVMPSPWQSGLRSYVTSGDDFFWVEQHHRGAELFSRGRNITPQGYTQFRSLTASQSRVFCVAAGPDKLPQIISVAEDGGEFKVISGGCSPLSVGECSKPVAMEFGPANKSYGYYYPATHRDYRLEQPSPLVVFLHGGPTASTYPVLNLKIQYWTQRGFAVIDLNYHGSSGYGRDYRMALQGQWGVIEIEDIRTCLQQMVNDGLVDPAAIFIRGNSSGGYSALNAMCDLDCFAGGASLYGVTDPLALTAATHKFESRYLDWLIGDPETEQQKYSDLAPVNKAAQINCPVIFFQGELDKVVVPEQTRSMIKLLQSRGINTQSVFFADEAHGFRKRDNQVRVLCEELKFYQAILAGS